MTIENMKYILIFFATLIFQTANTKEKLEGVRGDPIAIKQLEAMVETMGGLRIWSQLKSVHFKHRWYFWNKDSYLENEILDLTGPRSWITMKNETYSRERAYSPEHKYWNIINGEFNYTSDEKLANALERAPYSIYRIARAVAIGNSNYLIKFGEEEFPGTRKIELYGPNDQLHGFIVLNMNYEPLVWATTQYKYTFGPMKKQGSSPLTSNTFSNKL